MTRGRPHRTGAKLQGRRRRTGLTITAAPEAQNRGTEGQPQDLWMIAGLVSTSRKALILTDIADRGMTFRRPLRLTAPSAAAIVSKQRGFLSFNCKNF